MKIGDKVYVDEGDSIGCIEYTGHITAIDGDTITIKTLNGKIRKAQAHMVDPT